MIIRFPCKQDEDTRIVWEVRTALQNQVTSAEEEPRLTPRFGVRQPDPASTPAVPGNGRGQFSPRSKTACHVRALTRARITTEASDSVINPLSFLLVKISCFKKKVILYNKRVSISGQAWRQVQMVFKERALGSLFRSQLAPENKWMLIALPRS